MTATREISIALPHLRMAAKVWGDPSLPALLAVHGWLDNAASFDRLAPLLCQHFHIVALDLPGHGRSEHRPTGAWYHYVDYLGEVLAAADQLGWRQFSLLGHSLGGTIASVLAAVCPERVGQLLLIEALGPLAGEAGHALTQLQRALDQRAALQAKALRVFASEAEAVQARVKANGLSPEAARILVSRGIRAASGGFVWSSDARLTLASPQRYVEAQVLALLEGIRAPTQLILAQPAPSFLDEAMVNARIARVPGIEVVRLPGHHHLHLEDPQPVAAALLAFVAAGNSHQEHLDADYADQRG
ncbi:MAG TPA: alpha/beta hydrolase [Rudaea sp.]|jgi:pimeloyl-ACP methyl ester carboxylesterase